MWPFMNMKSHWMSVYSHLQDMRKLSLFFKSSVSNIIIFIDGK